MGISPAYYFLNGAVASQLYCPCSVDLLHPFTCNDGKNCQDVCDLDAPGCFFFQIPLSETNFTRITAWDYTRDAFGLDNRVSTMITILFGYCIAIRMLNILFLMFYNNSKR